MRKMGFFHFVAWAQDFFEICRRGNPEEIHQAVLSGMDVNARNVFGSTPLVQGISQGWKVKVIKTLIEMGADVNARMENNWTPLMIAAQAGNAVIVSLLLEAGADVDAKNRFGCTALMYAAGGETPDVVKLFLEKGVEINTRDNNGRTPLLWAMERSSSPEVISLLLEAGVDTTLVDNQGKGVSDYIQQNDNLRGTEIFRRFVPASTWWYSTPGEAHQTGNSSPYVYDEKPSSTIKVAGGVFLFIGIIMAVYGAVRINSFESQLGTFFGFRDYTGIATLVIGIILGVVGTILLARK